MAEAPREPVGVDETEAEPPAGTIPRVLLALDDPQTASHLAEAVRALEPAWQIVTAKSSIEAKRLVETHEFLATLVDYGLDGRRGTALLSSLVRLQPGARRVLVTADPTEAMLRGAVEEGRVHAILLKPITRERVQDLLANLERAPGPMSFEEAVATSTGSPPARVPPTGGKLRVQVPLSVSLKLHAIAAERRQTMNALIERAVKEHIDAWLQGRDRSGRGE